MIVLIIMASIILASISIIQFKNEAREYHQERLERKENEVKEHINYVLSTTTYPLTMRNLPLIFKDKIHELAQIHANEINIYSLDGKLLKSSKESFSVDKVAPPIPKYILKLVRSSIEKRFVDIKTIDGVKNRSSYSQIKDDKFKPLGILNLPYVEDDGFYEKELNGFLIRLGQVYSFMLLLIANQLALTALRNSATAPWHKTIRLAIWSSSLAILVASFRCKEQKKMFKNVAKEELD